MARLVTGYVRGKPAQIAVVEIDGCLVETVTAAAFEIMRTAAATAGVKLRITSGFRSMEEQTALWEERKDPAVRKLKGQAARPGWSNHQSGRAIDIHTGLTIAAFALGQSTPESKWLDAHARQYGFARTVSNEPWHFCLFAIQEDRSRRP